jgi:2-succinyl-5-enolpyruvyl-6-hydroxy-3-cyclohexene-1-carboxylate synthase
MRQYLRDADAQQFVVDPAGDWPEATFTASDLLVADPTRLAHHLAETVDTDTSAEWRRRFERAESAYWSLIEERREGGDFEGAILSRMAADAPEGTTLFVSNSMPVRDLDRFARPRSRAITVLGNRGASGIDGIISTALGAASATDGPLVAAIGDLAFYHDMNGLLALERCTVDATIVLLNNDGGGIFHMLPIESFEPPFTEQFKTPHGIDFEPTEDRYGLDYPQVDTRGGFVDAYVDAVASEGSDVIEVVTDAEESHAVRDELQDRVVDELSE